MSTRALVTTLITLLFMQRVMANPEAELERAAFTRSLLLSPVQAIAGIERDFPVSSQMPSTLALRMGELYLVYGMPQAAEDTFAGVLARESGPELTQRAWFYLAKLHYQRANYVEAHAALGRMRGPSTANDKLMLAQVLLAQGDARRAVQVLSAINDKDKSPAINYNLGVALLKAGETTAAEAALRKAGEHQTKLEPDASFVDLAWLGLGYQYLSAGDRQKAAESFNAVRRSDAYWPQAELGLAWAGFRPQISNDAPVSAQSPVADDLASIEHLLALASLHTNGQDYAGAVDLYQQAVTALSQEQDKISAFSQVLSSKGVVAFIPDTAGMTGSGWRRFVPLPANAQASSYLGALWLRNDWQETIKNYLDLQDLKRGIEGQRQRLASQQVAEQEAALSRRLQTLDSQLMQAHKNHEAALKKLALESVENQRQDAAAMLATARLGLAAAYDRMVTGGSQ